MMSILCLSDINSFNADHVRVLISNSQDNINKYINVELFFFVHALLMPSIALKMIKIDRIMSQLWRIVSK